jgi:hypothetical protein
MSDSKCAKQTNRDTRTSFYGPNRPHFRHQSLLRANLALSRFVVILAAYLAPLICAAEA